MKRIIAAYLALGLSNYSCFSATVCRGNSIFTTEPCCGLTDWRLGACIGRVCLMVSIERVQRLIRVVLLTRHVAPAQQQQATAGHG